VPKNTGGRMCNFASLSYQRIGTCGPWSKRVSSLQIIGSLAFFDLVARLTPTEKDNVGSIGNVVEVDKSFFL